MSKPDWCPVDLWSEVIQNSSDGGMIHPIAAARLAVSERDKQCERDAVIAESFDLVGPFPIGPLYGDKAKGAIRAIASAIRSNKTGE